MNDRELSLWMVVFAILLCLSQAFGNDLANLVSFLTKLGPFGNKTLGDYVDFSSILGVNYGNPIVRESYDFVVVGAGPAGCAVANKLSENPNINVLLLELGKAEIPIAQNVPPSFVYQTVTDYNFGYVSERQTGACLGLTNQQCAWHHGRGLGGSTIINNMIYTRGHPRQFDRWNASGNPGWSYQDVLPYLIRAEDANLKDFGDNGFHGKGGYLSVEDCPYRSSLVEVFVEGAKQAGLRYIDYNSDEQLGVSYTQYNTQRGVRLSAARALLNPIRDRKNLHILTKAWVTKVLIDEDTKAAYGVQYTRDKNTYTVRASREVILSAGAFGSAKLLMLSGIGPKDHLEELGIKVIQDLPVGQTLYEHPGVVGPVFTITKPFDHLSFESLITLPNIIQYFFGKGPLTFAFTEGLVYFKSPVALYPESDWPDVELILSTLQNGEDPAPGTQNFFRISDAVMDSYFRPLKNTPSFMYLALLMHSRTKGSMRLKSVNPYHHPVFNYTYFEDDRDLQALVHGIKEIIRISSQKPFTDLGITLHPAKLPGCESFEFNTDKYWRCHARTLTTTFYHYVGTCKMGPSTDSTAVVDARLRVHGVQKLRVIDIGIIPEAPSAHTVALAYLIGDKGADMIKQDNYL